MSDPSSNDTGAARSCAITLIICCVFGIFAMAHHPTLHSHAISDTAAEMAKIQGLNAVVHGGMIALSLLIGLCMAEYSALRGLTRFLPRSGLILFWFGIIAMCLGGLINGFVVPDLITNISTQPELQAQAKLLLSAAWASNQRLVALGAYLIAAAVLLYSIDLLRNGPKRRLIGALGCALAVLSLIWQFAQSSRFDLRNMQFFWLGLCVWAGLAAWVMWTSARPRNVDSAVEGKN